MNNSYFITRSINTTIQHKVSIPFLFSFSAVLYAWYKNNIYNFVRPDLKPYIFISHDSRLYFSEVTIDDAGQYYCVVSKSNQFSQSSPVSMPTRLQVDEGSKELVLIVF